VLDPTHLCSVLLLEYLPHGLHPVGVFCRQVHEVQDTGGDPDAVAWANIQMDSAMKIRSSRPPSTTPTLVPNFTPKYPLSAVSTAGSSMKMIHVARKFQPATAFSSDPTKYPIRRLTIGPTSPVMSAYPHPTRKPT
jgi:hypothetical protein